MPSVGAFTDPYVDPESGLLANSLGITDADGLRLAEADYSSLGLATLLRSGFRPSYTPEDLRAIHRELFGAVYPWAGEFRTVEIRKSTALDSPIFMPSANVENALGITLSALDAEDRLVGLDDDEFASKLASYFNDLNYIHPFREGNGRTQRVFWSLVAAEGGRRIDWPAISGRDLDVASEIARTDDDLAMLEGLLSGATSWPQPSLASEIQLMSDLASGMRHNSYDDYERYGDGSYYSR